MLCDKCKKNTATFHSTVNINGCITEQHLCQHCANSNFSFNNVFSPSYNDFMRIDEELTCKDCGYTLSDFKSTGLLGCPNCYKVFHNIVMSSIASIQPGKKHTGKCVVKDELDDTELKIKKLEIQLKHAVNEENYELASTLKKQIIALKEANNE